MTLLVVRWWVSQNTEIKRSTLLSTRHCIQLEVTTRAHTQNAGGKRMQSRAPRQGIEGEMVRERSAKRSMDASNYTRNKKTSERLTPRQGLVLPRAHEAKRFFFWPVQFEAFLQRFVATSA
jgi:hypothetical protein